MMKQPGALWGVLLLFCVSATAQEAAQPERVVKAIPIIYVTGLSGEETALPEGAIAALPRVEVKAEQHGATHVYEGPLLSDIIAKVGAPRGKEVHGKEMTDVIIIEARDGYKIALDLAGTDASVTPRRVILADRVDGAPISAEDGPFRLVVEGDLRPARAVRMVKAIRLQRLP